MAITNILLDFEVSDTIDLTILIRILPIFADILSMFLISYIYWYWRLRFKTLLQTIQKQKTTSILY